MVCGTVATVKVRQTKKLACYSAQRISCDIQHLFTSCHNYRHIDIFAGEFAFGRLFSLDIDV
jgi:hypothetical protein